MRKAICIICLAAFLVAFAACGAASEPAVNTLADAEKTNVPSKTSEAAAATPAASVEETKSPSSRFDVSEYEIEVSDDGVKITKYTGSEKTVVIPKEIDGKKVVAIGDFSFSECMGISEITVPDTVTRIDMGAFMGCTGLKKITLSESVTEIQSSAFFQCSSLEEIYIPKNVMLIESNPFEKCENLRNIEVDSQNIYYFSEDGVLFSREHSMLHTFPMGSTISSYAAPEGTEGIMGGAFAGCVGLTEVILPQSVTEIGLAAFLGCTGLTEVTLPQSVTEIDMAAFSECSGLVKINIPQGVEAITWRTFDACSSLASVSMEGVCYIGTNAFLNCISLTDINIPDSVVYVDETAFSGCENIRAVYKGKTYTYDNIHELSEDTEAERSIPAI